MVKGKLVSGEVGKKPLVNVKRYIEASFYSLLPISLMGMFYTYGKTLYGHPDDPRIPKMLEQITNEVHGNTFLNIYNEIHTKTRTILPREMNRVTKFL